MSRDRFHLSALACATIALVLAVGACGGSDDPDGDGTGGTGAVTGSGGDGGAGTGGSGGSGTGGSGGKGGCTSASDCRSGGICDPVTRTCTTETIACAVHADCGNGAICVDDTCVRNDTGGPCEEDANCKAGETCTGGYCGCMGEEIVAESVPPNVMILLDKSGSMDRSAGGGQTKWEAAVNAIESLLATYGDQIRFGLVVYPDGNRCAPGKVLVDVGANTASDIIDTLASTSPEGSTPIGASLEAMRGHPSLSDPGRENYVLLITDGEEMCDGDGESAVEDLLAQNPSVKTFVVGFGSGVDASELNAMAVAGGTALPGNTKYYQADDAASLEAAFADIGRAVLSCSYPLGDVPATLTADDIFIYFDGQAVPRSEADGWTYDKPNNQVIFHGPACESLRDGEVEDLVIVHGCPVIIG